MNNRVETDWSSRCRIQQAIVWLQLCIFLPLRFIDSLCYLAARFGFFTLSETTSCCCPLKIKLTLTFKSSHTIAEQTANTWSNRCWINKNFLFNLRCQSILHSDASCLYKKFLRKNILYNMPCIVHTIFINVFGKCNNDILWLILDIVISFIHSLIAYLLAVVYIPHKSPKCSIS